jgi:hypothetical protein
MNCESSGKARSFFTACNARTGSEIARPYFQRIVSDGLFTWTVHPGAVPIPFHNLGSIAEQWDQGRGSKSVPRHREGPGPSILPVPAA